MPTQRPPRKRQTQNDLAFQVATLENAERLIEAVKDSGNTETLTNHVQQAQIYLGGIDASLHALKESMKPAKVVDRFFDLLGEFEDSGEFVVHDALKSAAYQIGLAFMQGVNAAKEGK